MSINKLPDFVARQLKTSTKITQSSFAKQRYFDHLAQKSTPTTEEKWLVTAYEKLHSLKSKYNFLVNTTNAKSDAEKIYSEICVLQRQIAMREAVAFDALKARKFI
ncbi:hypothetical protein IJE86_04705 [bacterium]|nr:hypothetical protein [bacterium]